jgi:hypothetical protein
MIETERADATLDRPPVFLITIDTEGDNLWARPHEITTRNAEWLPRFQALCESFGLVPTYLVNYEMAVSQVFQRFAHDVIDREAAEIGMHLHAWNSPPIVPLTSDDFGNAPYLTRFPRTVMADKVGFMTELLRRTFQVPITSHRAGRYGFNGDYARLLAEHGYLVDCSVTPGVSWTADGGPDFTRAGRHPYFLDFGDVCRAGSSTLLEVPVTIVPEPRSIVDPLRTRLAPRSFARRVFTRLRASMAWLRPNGRNGRRMARLAGEVADREETHVEFILHSSELMPGGSPQFRSTKAIESLYDDLRALFSVAQRRFRGAGLSAFAHEWIKKESAAR